VSDAAHNALGDGPSGRDSTAGGASSRFRRAAELFEAVRHLPPEERERILSDRCGADAELLLEIRSLLSFHDRPSETLDTAILRTGIGATIGRYRIVDLLGEGGMGTVYRAVQEEPVRREVALKVIKLGMDTRQVVRRFEAERQALAQMEHPNVARVLDGGSTADGRPYFVMELVRGLPITQFADDKCLSIVARLKLLLDVCAAVQHAHQKGVMHRDLKPSNILVAVIDGRATVKVIDFGIAKALFRASGEGTMTTTLGMPVGTPDFMSPEQAAGGDLDVRSDVYGLGVILYELLVGVTPLRAKLRAAAKASGRGVSRSTAAADAHPPSSTAPSAPTLDDLRRSVRDEEPLRPLAALAGLGGHASRGRSTDASERERIATHRSTTPAALERRVYGDLEAIALKALALTPSRRYPTVAAFAEDLERHLRDDPVSARVPSVAYTLAKLARRHTVGLVAGILVLLAVFVGLVLALVGFGQARADRDLALSAQRTATALADEVRDELFRRDIDRGRQRISEGNLIEGRDLLWTAHLNRPMSIQALWALREMQWNRGPFIYIPHESTVASAAFMPDETRQPARAEGEAEGPRAFVALSEGTPRVVAPLTGASSPLDGPSVEGISADTSPDGRFGVVGDNDGGVTLWDLESLRFVRTLRTLARGRTHVRFEVEPPTLSGARSTLLVLGVDGLLRRLALDADGSPINEEILADAGPSATHAMVVGPDRRIAIGMGDGRLLVIDPNDPTGGRVPRIAYRFPRGVIGIDFSRDGTLLGATSASREFVILAAQRMGSERDTRWTPIIEDRISPGTVQDIRFSADGASAFLPGWWDTLELHIATGLRRTATPVLGAEMDLDEEGSMLLFAGTGHTCAFLALGGDHHPLRMTTLPESLTPHAFGVEDGTPLGAILCSDAQGITAVGFDGEPRWRVETARPRHMILSADGRRFAAMMQNRTIDVHDAVTGVRLARVSNTHPGEYGAMRFDLRGERLCYVTRSQGVDVLDIASGETCPAIPPGTSEILTVSFVPESTLLLACNRLAEYQIIDLATGVMQVKHGPSGAFSAAVAADGLSVALGLWLGDYLVWDLTQDGSQNALLVARGHSAFASRSMPHPRDPALWLSCSDDGTIRVWHRDLNQDLATLAPYGPRQAIRHVDWSRAGDAIHVVGPDRVIRTYSIPLTDRWIDASRENERTRLATPLGR
jgi:serine/threonine protein kinase/WD40 repeat protein